MNILLIDDDPDCLQSLAFLLKIEGHACQAFTAPEEALAAYRETGVDLVITDLRMPGINGIQVLQQVRSLNPDAKVVIFTAYWDEDVAIAAVNNRAHDFLGKPLNLEEILATIKRTEQENLEQKRIGGGHARLVMECAWLKRAYEKLQALLKEKNGIYKQIDTEEQVLG